MIRKIWTALLPPSGGDGFWSFRTVRLRISSTMSFSRPPLPVRAGAGAAGSSGSCSSNRPASRASSAVGADRRDAVLARPTSTNSRPLRTMCSEQFRSERQRGDARQPAAAGALLATGLHLLQQPVDAVDHGQDDRQAHERAHQAAAVRAGGRRLGRLHRQLQRGVLPGAGGLRANASETGTRTPATAIAAMENRADFRLRDGSEGPGRPTFSAASPAALARESRKLKADSRAWVRTCFLLLRFLLTELPAPPLPRATAEPATPLP